MGYVALASSLRIFFKVVSLKFLSAKFHVLVKMAAARWRMYTAAEALCFLVNRHMTSIRHIVETYIFSSTVIRNQMSWSQMSRCPRQPKATHSRDRSLLFPIIIAHRHCRQILTMVVEATDWLVAVTLWSQFRQPRRILVTAAEVSDARGDALLALVFSVVVELVGRLVVELAEGEVRGVVLE